MSPTPRTAGSVARRALAIALLPLLLVEASGAGPSAAFKAGTFDPPRLAPDFSLQGSDGHELRIDRFRGKVLLLAFGYSSCTEVCPVTLATFATARRKLGGMLSSGLRGKVPEQVPHRFA